MQYVFLFIAIYIVIGSAESLHYGISGIVDMLLWPLVIPLKWYFDRELADTDGKGDKDR